MKQLVSLVSPQPQTPGRDWPRPLARSLGPFLLQRTTRPSVVIALLLSLVATPDPLLFDPWPAVTSSDVSVSVMYICVDIPRHQIPVGGDVWLSNSKAKPVCGAALA